MELIISIFDSLKGAVDLATGLFTLFTFVTAWAIKKNSRSFFLTKKLNEFKAASDDSRSVHGLTGQYLSGRARPKLDAARKSWTCPMLSMA